MNYKRIKDVDLYKLPIEERENFTGIIEWRDGTLYYMLNGKHHNEEGPAIIWLNGMKCWYINGKRHRINGPAIEYVGINKPDKYYINDIETTKEGMELYYMLMKLKELI